MSFEDLSRLIVQTMRDGAPFDTGGGLISCLCNWNVEDFVSAKAESGSAVLGTQHSTDRRYVLADALSFVGLAVLFVCAVAVVFHSRFDCR